VTEFNVHVVNAQDVVDEWDELAQRVHASPFLYPGWFLAWAQAFNGGRLTLAVARRVDGRLDGALPLVSRGRVLRSPTNAHTPEFGILADNAGAVEALLNHLHAVRPRRWQLSLVDEAAAGAARSIAERHGYPVLTRILFRAPYLPIDGSFSAYHGSLSRNTRQNLSRRRRRLAEAGTVRIDVVEGYDEGLFKEFLRVEASGWKGPTGTGTAIAVHADTRMFYTRIAQWASERGWLRLAFLRLDGEALAVEFGLDVGRVHYFLKTGYRPEFRQYSPGMLLGHALVERSFALCQRSYEFLGSEEPYKMKWTGQSRPRWLVQAFAPTPLGVLEHAAYAHGRPFAKRVIEISRTARRLTNGRATPRASPAAARVGTDSGGAAATSPP
jgi:CelD/BcsL family acetyltransferase involved in cellulose biosynthesis